jgi:citronellol/citronellal dehydrogenase
MKNTKKTVVITGGGQGIGQAIAYRFASEGANIVIASKDDTTQMQETMDGIAAVGGHSLACDVDVRHCDELELLVYQTIAHFGGIDILINNTSAPCFNDIFHTAPEEFDLIMSTSVKAAFFLSKACFPYLQKSQNPHIINIAPPLNFQEQWLRDHLSFSLGKYGMSLCTLGMSASFRNAGIAVNSLWPRTNIATPRLKSHLLPEVYAGSRYPSIMAEAAYALSLKTFRESSGEFFIDEQLLRETGMTDFSHYAVDPQAALVQTLFLPLESDMIPISPELFRRKEQ